MIPVEVQRALANLFSQVASSELLVESLRCSLSSHSAFTYQSAFALLDRRALSRLEASDFLHYCKSAGIAATASEAKAVIAQYDGDEDGRLSIEEFSQMVLPASDRRLRTAVDERLPGTSLSQESIEALKKLVDSEFDFHRKVERAKNQLKRCEEFSLLEAFRAMDYEDLGVIERRAIVRFLKHFEQNAGMKTIDAILRRWDCDGDEGLTYKEFCEALGTERPQLLAREEISFRDLIDNSVQKPRKKPALESLSQLSSPKNATAATSPKYKVLVSSPRYTVTEPSFRANRPIVLTQRLTLDSPRTAIYTQESDDSFGPQSPRVVAVPATEVEKRALVDTFVELMECLRQSEAMKISLSACSDFTFVDAFLMFDESDAGEISPAEIEQTLRMFGIRVFADDARLLVSHFSRSGVLTLPSFSTMLSPASTDSLQAVNARVPQRLVGRKRKYAFQALTRAKVLSLMRLLLHCEHRQEALRQSYERDRRLRPQAVFAVLDRRQNGHVSTDDVTDTQLREFLWKYGVMGNSCKAEVLMTLYDKDGDGKISLREFLAGFTPQSAAEYI